MLHSPRYVDLRHITYDQIMRLREQGSIMPCADCEGRGMILERKWVQMFGQPVIHITAVHCDNCNGCGYGQWLCAN